MNTLNKETFKPLSSGFRVIRGISMFYVSFHSPASGSCLSGQDFSLTLSNDGATKAPQLEKYLRTPEDCLASVLKVILAEMLYRFLKMCRKMQGFYAIRLLKAQEKRTLKILPNWKPCFNLNRRIISFSMRICF